MCCVETLKRVVPFVITFALGLFVANIFFAATSGNSTKSIKYSSVEKKSKYKKTNCRFGKKKINKPLFEEEDVIFLVPTAPPPPPAPRVAPLNEIERKEFPPNPPKVLILPDEIK